jgi:hypothetical protein
MCRINLHNRPNIIYCVLLWKGIHVFCSLYIRYLITVYSKEWAGTWYFVVNFVAWLWKETFLTSLTLTKHLLLHLFGLMIVCIVLRETRTKSFTLRRWDHLRFKICMSVHHRTIQINHQPDATVFQFIILKLIYRSTCVGRSPAHHQELNDYSGSLWFYLRIVVIAVLCSWSGPITTNSTAITTIRR